MKEQTDIFAEIEILYRVWVHNCQNSKQDLFNFILSFL